MFRYEILPKCNGIFGPFLKPLFLCIMIFTHPGYPWIILLSLILSKKTVVYYNWFYVLILEHKICLVGLDNAGKTTILYQFLMNEVVHTSPTIGSNVEEVVWNNIHFIMWDLGGQESLRTSWNTYYSNTEVRSLINVVSFNLNRK